MADYIVSEPQRTEDGAFVVQLKADDGTVLAEGVGETLESAIEEAKSKL